MRASRARRCGLAGAVLPALLTGILGLSACGGGVGDDEAETLDRSVFVAAYVDLRVAALRSRGTLDPARRDTILAEHGVTEADLLEFAEVHGRDAAYMRDVWEDVAQKVDSARLGERGGG